MSAALAITRTANVSSRPDLSHLTVAPVAGTDRRRSMQQGYYACPPQRVVEDDWKYQVQSHNERTGAPFARSDAGDLPESPCIVFNVIFVVRSIKMVNVLKGKL